jgi:hypothetical protein
MELVSHAFACDLNLGNALALKSKLSVGELIIIAKIVAKKCEKSTSNATKMSTIYMSLAPLQGHFHRMKLQFHRLDELLYLLN